MQNAPDCLLMSKSVCAAVGEGFWLDCRGILIPSLVTPSLGISVLGFRAQRAPIWFHNVHHQIPS